jgi:four helix bundle protein
MSSTKIVSFRDLDAWQAAMELAVVAHEVAAQLPTEQRFELGSQIRRAATSVPSNVAEGHAHRSDRSYLRHVRIALGSLFELDTQLELACRQGLIETQDLQSPRAAIARTGQLLHGLQRALRRRFYTSVATNTSLLLGMLLGAAVLL